MDSIAPDALSTFLRFSLSSQLQAVAAWPIKRLRGLIHLHSQVAKQDGYPTMERQVEVAIGRRLSASLDTVEALFPLTREQQLAIVEALSLLALADLLSSYLAWCVAYSDQALHCDVHARMLQRLKPDGHQYPRERDLAAKDTGLPAEELQARLSAAELDHEILLNHLEAYERAEANRDAAEMARLTRELLAKRKD